MSPLFKNTYREILRSPGRFLAILAIIVLGSGFFVGLRVSRKAMTATADTYLAKTAFYDFSVANTLGLTDENLDAIRSDPHVLAAEGAFETDALVNLGGTTDVVFAFHSLPELINTPDLVSGRMPEGPGECLADSWTDIKIGDTVTLSPVNDDDTLDVFTRRSFTVTGLATSPLYLNFERGSTDLGSGSVTAFCYVPKSAFDVDYYTGVYIRCPDMPSAYSQAYDDLADSLEDHFTDLAEREAEARYNSILSDAETELADAEAEYADGLSEYETERADAEKELEDARLELEDAEAELEDARLELEDAKAELEDGKAQIEDGRRELEDGWRELRESEEPLRDAKAELDDAKAQLDEGRAELEANRADGQRELDEAEAELADARQELDDGESQYTDGLAEYEDGYAQYSDALEEYEAAVAKLNSGEAKYRRGLNSYNSGLKEYNDGWAVYSSNKAEYDAAKAAFDAQAPGALAAINGALSEYGISFSSVGALARAMNSNPILASIPGVSELVQAYLELETAGEALESARQQLDDSLAQLTDAKDTLDRSRAQLDDGWEEVSGARDTLDETRVQLEDAKAQLDDSRAKLDEGWQEYNDGLAEFQSSKADFDDAIAEAEAELADAEAQYNEGLAEYEDGLKKYNDGKAELEDAEAELRDAEREYADGLEKYEDGLAEYEDGLAEYEDGKAEYEDARAEADQEFADAEAELADAKREIDDARRDLEDLEPPESFVLGRWGNLGYVCFENDSSIVQAISAVFPVFFFLVAALICLTTVSRMVEEQRSQLGVLMAMGYSAPAVMGKFIFYSGAATVIGGIAGILLGSRLIPLVVWQAYHIMYTFSDTIEFVFDLPLSAITFSLYVAAMLAVTYVTCRRELRDVPANIIRPKPPKAGKRVILERVPFIWNHLSFLWKVTVRNIFRYKSRVMMMILGVAGCTALMLTGMGINDSIHNVVDYQFDEISRYDYSVTFSGSLTSEDMADFLSNTAPYASETVFLNQESRTASANRSEKEVQLNVLPDESLGSIPDFIDFHSGASPVPLPGSGQILINSGLSKSLDLSPGDAMTIRSDSGETVELTVSGVYDNYIYNSVYITEETYVSALGESPDINFALVIKAPGADPGEGLASILSQSNVLTSTSSRDLRERIGGMMDSLIYIVLLTIVCAAALAFVVIYNLTNINIQERLREIATVKVLGFYDPETALYVLRENILLTLLGAAVGIPMGLALNAYVVGQIDLDMIHFTPRVLLPSYLWSVALTILFSLTVDILMLRRLTRIDPASALKAAE